MIMNIMNVKDVKNVIHDDARVGDGNSDDDYDDNSRVSKQKLTNTFYNCQERTFETSEKQYGNFENCIFPLF